jgi:hypothetical protein
MVIHPIELGLPGEQKSAIVGCWRERDVERLPLFRPLFRPKSGIVSDGPQLNNKDQNATELHSLCSV